MSKGIKRDCEYYLRYWGNNISIRDEKVFPYCFGKILCCDNYACNNNTGRLNNGKIDIGGNGKPIGICLTKGYLNGKKENTEDLNERKGLIGRLISNIIWFKERKN